MTSGQISFPDRQASFVEVQPGADGRQILRVLEVPQPDAVIVVCDEAAGHEELLRAHPAARAQLHRLVNALARVAVSSRALVITGGTEAGVAAMVGRAIAGAGEGATTLGVAPVNKVGYPGGPAPDERRAALEPNHDHFALIDGEGRGDEAGVVVAVAAAAAARSLSERAAPESSDVRRRRRASVAMVSIHGGDECVETLLQAARRGWPIVLVAGSGGLADRLAGALACTSAPPVDPRIAELLASATFHVVAVADDPARLGNRLAELLDPEGREELLIHAWSTFARLDDQALRHQREFRRLQLGIAIVGLLAVLVAVLMASRQSTLTLLNIDVTALGSKLLKFSALALPIVLSVMMAASSRFKLGSKWVLMRGAAEAIKREIFLFRTSSSDYSEALCRDTSRTARLAERLARISRRVMATTVNEAAMPAYTGPIPPKGADAGGRDDGMGDLDANQYIEIRVGDQIAYFTEKTARLERQLRHMSWLIYAFGGVGTLLAASGAEPWIALTTAAAAAIASQLEWQQTEYSLIKYNQARTDLENLRSWWQGLTPAQHAEPGNAGLLVAQVERVLEFELSGWVQQMQDALVVRQPLEPQAKPKDGAGDREGAAVDGWSQRQLPPASDSH